MISRRQKVDNRLLKPIVIKLRIRPLVAHLSQPDAQRLQELIRFKLLLSLSDPLTVQLCTSKHLLIQLLPELLNLCQLILRYHASLSITFILIVNTRCLSQQYSAIIMVLSLAE